VFTLPTTEGSQASGFLLLDDASAQPVLDVFRGNNIFENVLALVRAQVRNGTGLPGQADAVADELEAAGFTVTARGDASSFENPRTVVRHAPGEVVAAVVVARHLAVDPLIEETTEDLGDAAVVVVTGEDWAGLRAEPRPVEDFADLLPADAALPEGGEGDTAPAGAGIEDAGLGAPATTSSTVEVAVSEPPPGVSCG
jgi:hypothetical protein